MSSESSPIYVIGHRNPDTDALCAAIGHAEFLRITENIHAVAARCGEIPQRTSWVLQKAQLPDPELLMSVRITAGQICRRQTVTCSPSETFLSAYRTMTSQNVRTIPVVNSSGFVLGILKNIDLLTLLLPTADQTIKVRRVQTCLLKIVETLQADVYGAPFSPSLDEETYRLLVSASSEQVVAKRLQKATEKGTIQSYLVLSGDRPEVHRIALQAGVKALIITGGFRIDSELELLAKKKSIPIICCHQDTASTTQLIRCSRLLRNALGDSFHTIDESELLTDLTKKLSGVTQELFPVLNQEKKLVGVFSKSDLVTPKRTQLVLVDHNEYSQAVDGVEEADILEVIDHHRLGGDLTTRQPIRFLNEPVGSTSTLVARKFLHRGLQPSRGVAICLIAGLISDTLHLSSPTTTMIDRDILKWLSSIAQIDTLSFTKDFFKAGSLLNHASAQEILTTDRKEFYENGVKISISQIEELGLEVFESRHEELHAALQELHQGLQNDLSFLVITDIGTHYSLILALGDPSYLKHLPFSIKSAPHLFEAKGFVSRKKQIFPAICQAILLQSTEHYS